MASSGVRRARRRIIASAGATANCRPVRARCTVDHRSSARTLAFGGTVGAGEAYIRGLWRCDDLIALVRIFVAQPRTHERHGSGWAFVSRPLLKLFHWLNRNTRNGSARNIAAHYDLGNELFELFLDETMTYSCAHLRTPDATLAEGVDREVRRRLPQAAAEARPITCSRSAPAGAASPFTPREHYGCRVTTTTISREQHDSRKQRIARARAGRPHHAAARRTIAISPASYDKLVSIEMIEAVGHQFLDGYFRQVRIAAEARRRDAAAGDHDPGPALRAAR